jgi:membrane protein implicated in regulation of membrane protease activity
VVGFDALFTGLAQGRVPWVLVAVAVGAAVLLALLVSRLRRRLQDEPPGNEAE